MSVDDTQYIERVIFYVFFRIVQGIYSCNESASWEQSAWQNHYEDVLSLFHNSQRPLIHSAGIFCVPTNWGIRCIMNISNNFYHWHFTGLYRGWWLVVIQPVSYTVYNILVCASEYVLRICCHTGLHATSPMTVFVTWLPISTLECMVVWLSPYYCLAVLEIFFL